jgi:hypothetical protein
MLAGENQAVLDVRRFFMRREQRRGTDQPFK